LKPFAVGGGWLQDRTEILRHSLCEEDKTEGRGGKGEEGKSPSTQRPRTIRAKFLARLPKNGDSPSQWNLGKGGLVIADCSVILKEGEGNRVSVESRLGKERYISQCRGGVFIRSPYPAQAYKKSRCPSGKSERIHNDNKMGRRGKELERGRRGAPRRL